MVVINRLLIFGDRNKMRFVLEREDREILQILTFALLLSRSSGKSTNASWIGHFIEGAGKESDMVVEATLSYNLSPSYQVDMRMGSTLLFSRWPSSSHGGRDWP